MVLLQGELLRLQPVDGNPLHVTAEEVRPVAQAHQVQVARVEHTGPLGPAIVVVLLLERSREQVETSACLG